MWKSLKGRRGRALTAPEAVVGSNSSALQQRVDSGVMPAAFGHPPEKPHITAVLPHLLN